MESKLGYLLSGPLPSNQADVCNSGVFHISAQSKENDQSPLNFWTMESADFEEKTLKDWNSDFVTQYPKIINIT